MEVSVGAVAKPHEPLREKRASANESGREEI
jgi:hypothetical protein